MKTHGGDLRERLVREAIALLGRSSEEVSLRAVARAAGVSAMAPYRHFEDKAALLGAASEAGFTELRRDLEEADDHAEPREALIRQGAAYIAYARRQPNLFRLMFVSPEAVCKPQPSGDGAYDVLARRVAEIVPEESRTHALACWALVHGLASLSLDRRLEIDMEAERAVLTLFVGSIARR